MKPIVLKHLAQEFQATPRRLRMILRKHKLEPTNSRWQWDSADPALHTIRAIIKKELKK